MHHTDADVNRCKLCGVTPPPFSPSDEVWCSYCGWPGFEPEALPVIEAMTNPVPFLTTSILKVA